MLDDLLWKSDLFKELKHNSRQLKVTIESVGIVRIVVTLVTELPIVIVLTEVTVVTVAVVVFAEIPLQTKLTGYGSNSKNRRGSSDKKQDSDGSNSSKSIDSSDSKIGKNSGDNRGYIIDFSDSNDGRSR